MPFKEIKKTPVTSSSVKKDAAKTPSSSNVSAKRGWLLFGCVLAFCGVIYFVIDVARGIMVINRNQATPNDVLAGLPFFSVFALFVCFTVMLFFMRMEKKVSGKDKEEDEEEGTKETREGVEGMAKFENYKDAYTVEKDDNDDDEEDEGTYVRRNVTKIFSFSPGNDKFTIGLSLNVSDNTETYWYRDAGAKGHKVTSRICSEDSDEFIEVISSVEYNSEPRMEEWYDEDNDKTLYVFLVPETWDLKVIQTN